MHKLVFFNDEILSSDKPNIKAITSASLYGKGVFTTLAVRDSTPLLWEKHWRRLNDHAEKMGVDLSRYSKAFVERSLTEIIKENRVINGRCRITFFDESLSKIWKAGGEKSTSVLIQTADLRKEKKQFSITISPFIINSKSPLAGIKSCNYLENVMALEDARSKGFDEAIRLNEKGEITAACMANVFWEKNGKLFTPSLKTGCLAGITREDILENQEVFEVKESLEVIKGADEIFLTSSGIGFVKARF